MRENRSQYAILSLLRLGPMSGYDVKAACEYEFFVFDETPHSAREKGYRNLTPFTPPHFIDIWTPANGNLITIQDPAISTPVVNVTSPTEGQFFNAGSPAHDGATSNCRNDVTYCNGEFRIYKTHKSKCKSG